MPYETAAGKAARFRNIIRPIDWLTDLGSIAAALCLMMILILVMAEIVARNVFSAALDFTWDISGYLMGACFMLAAAGAMSRGVHVRVTALVEVLPPRAARLTTFAACAMGILICIALSRALVDMAWMSGVRGTMSATSFRVPLVWPQAALAAGSVMLTLQCIAQFLRLIRGEDIARSEGIEESA